jgi:hypothetical protein
VLLSMFVGAVIGNVAPPPGAAAARLLIALCIAGGIVAQALASAIVAAAPAAAAIVAVDAAAAGVATMNAFFNTGPASPPACSSCWRASAA